MCIYLVCRYVLTHLCFPRKVHWAFQCSVIIILWDETLYLHGTLEVFILIYVIQQLCAFSRGDKNTINTNHFTGIYLCWLCGSMESTKTYHNKEIPKDSRNTNISLNQLTNSTQLYSKNIHNKISKITKAGEKTIKGSTTYQYRQSKNY